MQSRRLATLGILAAGTVIGLSIPSLAVGQSAKTQAKLSSSARTSFGDMRGVNGGDFGCATSDSLTITESQDLTIVSPNGSLLCGGSGGATAASYGRFHADLATIETDGNALVIDCVTWAIETNNVPAEATCVLYAGGDGTLNDLGTVFGTASATLPVSPDPTFILFPFAGLAIPTDTVTGEPQVVFVELQVPDVTLPNQWNLAGNTTVGANALGQDSPSYTRSVCTGNSWADLATLSFGSVHWVQSMDLRIEAPADPCNDPLPPCPQDVAGPTGGPDGEIGVDDVLQVIGNFGQTGDGSFRPVGDVDPLPNGNCVVDVDDLLSVISTYGQICEPPVSNEFTLNELRVNQSGADDNEAFEVFGPANASLDGLSFVVLGDGTGNSPLGHVETIVSLEGLSLDNNGLYGGLLPANTLENGDPNTYLLVRDLTVELTEDTPTVDLDLNDDGILDSEPWSAVLDSVAFACGGIGETVYSTTVVGPSGDFCPGGAYRCPDGVGDWSIAPFELGCTDTPGAPNTCGDDVDGDGLPACADNCPDVPNADQADCDGDGEGDACDLGADCNSNDIPDDCEIDCNLNGVPDDCDIAQGTVSDCNQNGIPDSCENDCNANGVADECDISNGDSQDANGNGVPDECESSVIVINEIHADPAPDLTGDANGDGTRDSQDDEFLEIVNKSGAPLYLGGATITDAVSTRHTFPVETPVLDDGCVIVVFGGGDPATFTGSFGNAVIQVASGGQLGLNNGGDTVSLIGADGVVIDQVTYQAGSNQQSITRLPDVYGINFSRHSEADLVDGSLFSPGTTIEGSTFGGSDCGSGSGVDSDEDGVPDSFDNCVDLPNADQADCDGNQIGDVCDIADGTYSDCDANGIPDVCDPDCNGNNIADGCDIADGTSADVDGNGIPDECESSLSACYDWGDGQTAMGSFGGDVIWTNVADPLGGDERALKIEENPVSGTPQTFVAHILNLTDGDTVSVSLKGLGGNGETSRVRLWGHYTASTDIDDFSGSASGPGGFSENNTSWTQLSHQWIFDSDNGGNVGLVIEVRIYTNADQTVGNFGHVKDLSVNVSSAGDTSGVSILFPGAASECVDTAPLGGCCELQGGSYFCFNTTADDCGGEYYGDGILCDSESAPVCTDPGPQGACCFDDQPCQVTTADLCGFSGGSYVGDGTTCSTNPCGGGSGDGGAWINEIHYDNTGSDVDEAIEVVILTGTNPADCTVTLYNGSNGNSYNSFVVGTDFTAGASEGGYTVYSLILPANGLQNGAPDGLSLDIGGTVVEFLSYEGTMTAANGPAAGLTSEDLGVSESSATQIGDSLGRIGEGAAGPDFSWTVLSGLSSPGSVNDGQTISP